LLVTGGGVVTGGAVVAGVGGAYDVGVAGGTAEVEVIGRAALSFLAELQPVVAIAATAIAARTAITGFFMPILPIS
jgi:hypothetical protein